MGDYGASGDMGKGDVGGSGGWAGGGFMGDFGDAPGNVSNQGTAAGGGRDGWFAGLGDSYDLTADVLATDNLPGNMFSGLDGRGEPVSAFDKLQKARLGVQSLVKEHPWAFAMGTVLSMMMGLPMSSLPGLMFAAAADQIGKARQTGFTQTVAKGMSGLDAAPAGSQGGGADTLSLAEAQADTAAAAQMQNTGAAAGASTTAATAATPESAAASAAAEARRSARQRSGLMAMRITNPWAMLTDAATVFRPGVFV
jgi:hypothetical protein